MLDQIRPVLKSRKLSVLELFNILQQEYIVCELRYKFYPEEIISSSGQRTSPKEYWKQVMEKKKAKILDISIKKFFPSIFDDDKIMQEFRKKIIPEIGYPNFIYRDQEQKLMQEKWDKHNYYSKNASVKIMVSGGKIEEGIIEYANFIESRATIYFPNSGNKETIDFDLVTRIL